MEENKNTEVVEQAEEVQAEAKPVSKKQAQINEIQEKAEKTDLVFDGTPNEKEFRSFLLYNAYTSPMGIFTVFVGILCIVLFVVRGNSMLTFNSYTLLFVGLVMMTGYPFFIICQAKWRAHDKKAMKIRYTFLIDGVKSNVGDDAFFVRWKRIFKVRETKYDILLYLDHTRAMIVPKRPLGDRVNDVKGLIDRHMVNRKRVRWKSL